jgi:Beta-galactosidase/beta-glucuronidase
MRIEEVLFRSVLCFIVFIGAIELSGQDQMDDRLIDSLINVGAFPMALADENRRIMTQATRDRTILYSYQSSRQGKPGGIDFFSASGPIYYTYPSFERLNGYVTSIIPTVHVALSYPYTRFYPGETYPSFCVQYAVRNFGDTTNWNMSDFMVNLLIEDEESNFVLNEHFGRVPLNKSPEGFASTVKHEVGYGKGNQVTIWSHVTPKNYFYTIEVLDRKKEPYEYISGKIGFRSVAVRQGEVILNKSSIRLKAAGFDPLNSSSDLSMVDRLRVLKCANFNAIVLKKPATTELLDWCDSNGLYVVQDLNSDAFPDLDGLLQYFVDVKDHPSLILWNDTGLESETLRIFKRLEFDRPILKNFNAFQIFVEDWFLLQPEEQLELKDELQPFAFYYLPQEAVLKMSLKDGFRFLENLTIEWVISDSMAVPIRSGTMALPPFLKGQAAVSLPEDAKAFSEGEFRYDFKISVNKDCYPYDYGHVVGEGSFRFLRREDKLIYETD